MIPGTTIGDNIWRGRITIPSSSDEPKTLRLMLTEAGFTGMAFVLVRVLGALPEGPRGAFIAGSPRAIGAAVTSDDITTHGERVAAGADYEEPSKGDLDTGFRSTTVSEVPAIAVVIW